MNKLVKGKYLYLRKLEISDLERTWEWLHRPDIYSKLGVKVPFSKFEQQQWFDSLQNDNSKIVFAICRNIDDIHIGNVSLDMIDTRHFNARFSIFIADASLRGKGAGTEALMLLERYAFSTLNLHKIWCKTDAGFPEIFRFYKNIGFEKEGLFREHEFKDGKFIDKIILAKISSIV